MDDAPVDSPVLDALERYADFVDEIHNQPRPRLARWEGNVDQLAIRSLGHLLCKWRHSSRPDRPPHALIVRLAMTLPDLLTRVCRSPKHLLSRRRSVQPLRRLRELDSTCVRWITRQPGVSLVEKAGHRQAVLAVERFESMDTLENRVVLSLLRLCRALARSYLRQHESRFPSHDRVRSTSDFFRLCTRLLADPKLREISPLSGVPKPNYVLLHDDRYHKIWRAFLEVSRQQRRKHLLWEHRLAVYTEMATIGFWCAASRRCQHATHRKAAHRHDVWIRQRPIEGQFLDWRLSPPLWQVDSEHSVYVGPEDIARSMMPTTTVRENGPLVILSRRGEITEARFLRFDIPSLATPDPDKSDLALSVRTEARHFDGYRMSDAEVVDLPLFVLDRQRELEKQFFAWCR